MQNELSAKRLAYRGILVAVAMALSWLELQFSATMIIPGMKLGLTNLVVLVALYKIGEKDAVFLNIIRIGLVGALFGNGFSIIYSLAGGLVSGAVMILAVKIKKISVIGVSLLGGISHNIGQILVAMILLQTKQIVFYLPFLWISGALAGIVVGVIGAELVKRLPEIKA